MTTSLSVIMYAEVFRGEMLIAEADASCTLARRNTATAKASDSALM